MVDEDAHRRGAAGLRVVRGPGTASGRCGRAGVAAEQLVGERGEVGSGEELVTVVAHRSAPAASAAVRIDWSVSHSACSRGREVVLDDGGAAADLPQGPAAGEVADEPRSAGVSPRRSAAAAELVGRLAEDDLGGGVGQEAGGDLGGGGAVVGLGGEVARPVGDGDVGDAVGAAELEAGLEVAGGVAVAEQAQASSRTWTRWRPAPEAMSACSQPRRRP